MRSRERHALRIDRFGVVPSAPTPERVTASAARALVRVTHAAVGVTDVMAIRGDYLMQPLRGFVPGYDFIGTVEHLPSSHDRRLSVGQRVAGLLPRMGSHASVVAVKPALLVAVPDSLDSAVAATIPLDAITARFALDMLPDGTRSVLVNGAGGAVGAWAVQMAAATGCRVLGTASERSRVRAERLGAEVLDYRDPDWIDHLLLKSGGGVDGALDHTGSHALRRAVVPGGRVIRIAFTDTRGHQRVATATGFLRANARRYASPSERVCSTPMLLGKQNSRFHEALAEVFTAVADGALLAAEPRTFAVARYAQALSAAGDPAPGTKVVLVVS